MFKVTAELDVKMELGKKIILTEHAESLYDINIKNDLCSVVLEVMKKYGYKPGAVNIKLSVEKDGEPYDSDNVSVIVNNDYSSLIWVTEQYGHYADFGKLYSASLVAAPHERHTGYRVFNADGSFDGLLSEDLVVNWYVDEESLLEVAKDVSQKEDKLSVSLSKIYKQLVIFLENAPEEGECSKELEEVFSDMENLKCSIENTKLLD